MDSATAVQQADALMTAAAENLQKPIEAPVATGIDTSKSKKALEVAATQGVKTEEVITKAQADFEAGTRAKQIAIKEGAQAQADSLAADAARSQEAANIHRFFSDLQGLTVDGTVDMSSDIAKLTIAKRQHESVAMAELGEIRNMQSVGPLDDPLEYFANALTLPSKIAAYNKRVDAVNNMQRTIDSGINTATQASAEVTKTIPTLTAAQAAAQARKAKADAEANVAIADENLAKQNVDFASKQLADKLNLAKATNDQSQLELNNQRLKYESQINAVRIAESHAQRQLAAAKLITEVGQGAALDVLLQNYDVNMGNPKGTTTRYLFNRLSDEQQKNMAAIGAGSGGSDPYQYLVNVAIKARPGPEMSDEKKAFISWLSDKATTISKTLLDANIPKELHPQEFGKRLKVAIEEEKLNAGKVGTLFHEISPKNMILAGPAGVPPDSELAKILDPLTKAVTDPSTNTVVKTIAASIKNPTDAGQLVAEYYQRNMKIVNNSIPLSMAGVKPIEGYPVKAKLGLIGSNTFDLTKPADATKYIIMLQQGERFGEGMKGMGKFN